MDRRQRDAFATGYERLAAWADLLDAINLFPVADRDTGRNLMISLAPLHRLGSCPEDAPRQLLMGATGNSGNIAACFFAGFIRENPFSDMVQATRIGRDDAWQSIADPQAGTMLAVFDELLKRVENPRPQPWLEDFPAFIAHLERAVQATSEILPRLKSAGVVDAGALGMYIFLEGFFGHLAGNTDQLRSIAITFQGKLKPQASDAATEEKGYCIDTVIKLAQNSDSSLAGLAPYGQSIVVHRDSGHIKVHLHTEDRQAVRQRLEAFGTVERWAEEDMGAQGGKRPIPKTQPALHIVTDAAGSVTRDDAARYGMTLLDSYIVCEGRSLPETLMAPETLYGLMRKNIRVTTAQASVFERHQQYQSIISRFGSALYLCVGSFYTGNYRTVVDWRKKNDKASRLSVIDTGMASGRLGIVALATARFSCRTGDPRAVVDYAKRALGCSEEFIFIDRLQYLVSGGRLSKTKGFFGDLLGVKPVVTPTARGAAKIGAVRNRNGQLTFALDSLQRGLGEDIASLIMLEYTDNLRWVRDTVLREISRRYPKAEILLQPLSLTSGVHMGPGTWAVAFLPSVSRPES
jgi:DegV family protein with EDD domain